jgi:hypothetical protein
MRIGARNKVTRAPKDHQMSNDSEYGNELRTGMLIIKGGLCVLVAAYFLVMYSNGYVYVRNGSGKYNIGRFEKAGELTGGKLPPMPPSRFPPETN